MKINVDMNLSGYGVIPEYTIVTEENKTLMEYCNSIDDTLPLDEIRRKDYISLLNVNNEDLKEFFTNKMMEIVDAYNNYTTSYKDYIFFRHYFKEFVIREKVRTESGEDIGQTRYYHYKISGERNKTSDFRILNINIYTSLKDAIVNELSVKIFLSHTIFMFLNMICSEPLNDDYFAKEDIFRGAPILILKKDRNEKMLWPTYAHVYGTKEYTYMPTGDDLEHFNNFLSQAIGRYVVMNYYMLNKVESNESISIDNKEYDSIVEYVKSKAKMDKKVKIQIDPINIKLIADPKRKNIYSHDNYQIRRLCDYKFQVKGHYQRYHYKDGSTKWIWKEAFYKNKDKEFNIIKERSMNHE